MPDTFHLYEILENSNFSRVTENTSVVACGGGKKWMLIEQSIRKLWGVMEIFCIWIEVVFTWLHTFFETHLTVHSK